MRTIPFPFIFSLFCLFACEKQDTQVLFAPEIAASCVNCVQLDALSVGQVSYYQTIKGDDFYRNENPDLNYLDDTLQLKVVDQEGDLFFLEETIITAETDQIFQYTVKVDKEHIVFSRYREGDLSSLVDFRGQKSISFPIDLSEAPQARMKGWYIENDCDMTSCLYQMDEFQDKRNLNVYLDYSPMAYDGHGYYAIYDKSYLYRSMSVGSWVPEGNGWELIR